ncbi:hypothetical protein L1987_35739 [Smallanthus sonchifolius]|uniref:Uncharacterized protein n=1 Tax=Smallanthus sonchifolius TaxID=185202 RepID=A0ACB9HBL1_9ASTR|nr:hypothetical protein L1987_35739 [Smallanthus sonchifolius]
MILKLIKLFIKLSIIFFRNQKSLKKIEVILIPPSTQPHSPSLCNRSLSNYSSKQLRLLRNLSDLLET